MQIAQNTSTGLHQIRISKTLEKRIQCTSQKDFSVWFFLRLPLCDYSDTNHTKLASHRKTRRNTKQPFMYRWQSVSAGLSWVNCTSLFQNVRRYTKVQQTSSFSPNILKLTYSGLIKIILIWYWYRNLSRPEHISPSSANVRKQLFQNFR